MADTMKIVEPPARRVPVKRDPFTGRPDTKNVKDHMFKPQIIEKRGLGETLKRTPHIVPGEPKNKLSRVPDVLITNPHLKKIIKGGH